MQPVVYCAMADTSPYPVWEQSCSHLSSEGQLAQKVPISRVDSAFLCGVYMLFPCLCRFLLPLKRVNSVFSGAMTLRKEILNLSRTLNKVKQNHCALCTFSVCMREHTVQWLRVLYKVYFWSHSERSSIVTECSLRLVIVTVHIKTLPSLLCPVCQLKRQGRTHFMFAELVS